METHPVVALLLFATTGIAVGTALSAFRHSTVFGRRAFGGAELAIAVWAFTAFLELGVADLAARTTIAVVQYLGIVSLPVFWLRFAGAYAHTIDPRSRWAAALWLIPVATVAAAATNDSHHLLWSAVVREGTRPVDVVFRHGPLFWVNWGYAYVLLALSTWWLVRALVRLWPSERYRSQTWLLLGGMAIPWIANLVSVLGLLPNAGVDLTPVAFGVSGVCVVIGTARLRRADT